MPAITLVLAWWNILILIVVAFACLAGIILLISNLKIKIKTPGGIEIGKQNSVALMPAEHRDYLVFNALIFRFMIQIKDFIRAGCLQNGFNLMDDDEWRLYKDEKFKTVGAKALKFFGENSRGFSVVKINLFVEETKIMPTIEKEFHALYDMIRELSMDQYSLVALKEKELISIYEEHKNKILGDVCTDKDILQILLDYGRRMVEIHEMKTRRLVDLQMNKAEEKLSYISDTFVTKFSEYLSTFFAKGDS